MCRGTNLRIQDHEKFKCSEEDISSLEIEKFQNPFYKKHDVIKYLCNKNYIILEFFDVEISRILVEKKLDLTVLK